MGSDFPMPNVVFFAFLILFIFKILNPQPDNLLLRPLISLNHKICCYIRIPSYINNRKCTIKAVKTFIFKNSTIALVHMAM